MCGWSGRQAHAGRWEKRDKLQLSCPSVEISVIRGRPLITRPYLSCGSHDPYWPDPYVGRLLLLRAWKYVCLCTCAYVYTEPAQRQWRDGICCKLRRGEGVTCEKAVPYWDTFLRLYRWNMCESERDEKPSFLSETCFLLTVCLFYSARKLPIRTIDRVWGSCLQCDTEVPSFIVKIFILFFLRRASLWWPSWISAWFSQLLD